MINNDLAGWPVHELANKGIRLWCTDFREAICEEIRMQETGLPWLLLMRWSALTTNWGNMDTVY